MSKEISIPERRTHGITQQYGEADDAYRDRLEAKATTVRRVERADSVRAMAIASAAEILGL